jgi:2-polyprenyl-6-methoxyphenol hydroxylase-like FAD-dependent oxidoreductase
MLIMARLGLAGEVRALGREVETGEVRDLNGRLLTVMDARDAERVYGAPMIAMTRGSLGALLAAHVPPERLRLGARSLSLHDRPAGRGLSIRFDQSHGVDAQLVIGADGANSVMRGYVAPDARLHYSGQVSYRGVAPIARRVALPPVSREIWGPGQRFGFVRVSEDDLYWFCTLDEPFTASDLQDEHRHARLQRLFARFPGPVPAILAESDPESTLRLPMHDLTPPARWHRGPVVLMGDAAHATTPNLGQGGAQAIEDAWVLADRLAKAVARAPSAPLVEIAQTAFSEYERIRARKARMVVRTSRRLGEMAHWRNPLARALRNALFTRAPKRVMQRQLDALFRLPYLES